jgi:hypothetical protein
MSRSQGDAYKTWTDHNLNAYKARLDAKLRKLIDHHEKWFRCGEGWVLAEERNRIFNPNGSWKWNGWEIEAHEYLITVFPKECVEVVNGKPKAVGWSQVSKVIDDDREEANRFFKVAQKLARNLKTWIPKEADNKPFFDYEGRKPEAIITMNWDGDTYFYTLVVDGEKVLNAYHKHECVEEADRLGAELKETHTP